MHHAADGVCALLPEGLQHFRVRLTGVEDDGLAEFESQANLGAEGLELSLLAGRGGEEVQADLADAHNLGVLQGQRLQLVVDVIVQRALEVGGVESDAGIERAVFVGEGYAAARGGEGGPGADHEAHVGRGGPLQNVGDFRGWKVVQVGMSVY